MIFSSLFKTYFYSLTRKFVTFNIKWCLKKIMIRFHYREQYRKWCGCHTKNDHTIWIGPVLQCPQNVEKSRYRSQMGDDILRCDAPLENVPLRVFFFNFVPSFEESSFWSPFMFYISVIIAHYKFNSYMLNLCVQLPCTASYTCLLTFICE